MVAPVPVAPTIAAMGAPVAAMAPVAAAVVAAMDAPRADRGGLVRPHERVDDLQRSGLVIIQNPVGFRFGMDAVFLAEFATVRDTDRGSTSAPEPA